MSPSQLYSDLSENGLLKKKPTPEDDKNIDRLMNNSFEENDSNLIYPIDIQPDSARYSLYEIKRLIEKYKEIDMNPSFQRKYIWTIKQQSELIESILMGIPLPLFYFATDRKGRYAVVDGLQRINTILRFMNDKFSISKVSHLKRIEGKFFSSIERSAQAKIEKYQIQAYIIPVSTPERVKLDIFDRINRGGTKLNSQEMCHALYPGKSTNLLKILSEAIEFREATGGRLNSKRMRDRYVILRFLTLFLWKNREQYKLAQYGYKTEISSDFDDFFAQYMQILNVMPDEELNQIASNFIDTMTLACTIYGKNAFTRDHNDTMPFNMTLFESLSYILMSIANHTDISTNFIKEKISMIEKDAFFSKNTKYSPSSARLLQEHFDHLDKFIPLHSGD